MARVYPLGVILALAVLAVSNVNSLRAASYSQIVELGTFNAADTTCFLRKINKGQPSPANFNFVAGTAINYAKAVVTSKNPFGGVTMTITAGAFATTTLSVDVMEAANKNYFVNDIIVTMRCAP